MTAKECRARFYENNKDKILAHKRDYYQLNKEKICRHIREDKVPCELCSGILFRRLYLKRHMEIRHGIIK